MLFHFGLLSDVTFLRQAFLHFALLLHFCSIGRTELTFFVDLMNFLCGIH